jgi:hypothetical protein
MGTRSVICIYYKGRFVVAQYTQFDGYPEGQGLQILKFLKNPTNIIHLKEGLEHHIYNPTNDELKEIDKRIEELEDEARERDRANGTFPWGYRSPLTQFFPSLSREAGARIFDIIATAGCSSSGAEPTAETKATGEVLNANAETAPITKGEKLIPISLDLEFVNDGLFCEWAYAVDLDTNVFEVFGGAESKKKSTSKRWIDVGDEKASVPGLVKSFDIQNLPTEKGYLESFYHLHEEEPGSGYEELGPEEEGEE